MALMDRWYGLNPDSNAEINLLLKEICKVVDRLDADMTAVKPPTAEVALTVAINKSFTANDGSHFDVDEVIHVLAEQGYAVTHTPGQE